MSFFENFDPKFVAPVDEVVHTEPFLSACEQILPLFDKLGKSYYPVKKDIGGNIEVLQKKHASNPEKCRTIRGLLQDEFDNGMEAEKPTQVALSCLWLRRALEFVCLFIKYFAEDHRTGEQKESIGCLVQRAYDESLKRYHGWFTQKFFKLMLAAVPYRKDLLKKLCNDDESREEQCYTAAEDFVQNLSSNYAVIGNLLKELNLDSDVKV